METENADKTIGIRVAIGDLRDNIFNKVVGTYIRSKRAKDRIQLILLLSNTCVPKKTLDCAKQSNSIVLIKKMELGG